MDYDNIIRLTSEAMLLCLMVSLPVVAVSAVVGLLVSFVQAITSLQDQSISQGTKLIAVVIPWSLPRPGVARWCCALRSPCSKRHWFDGDAQIQAPPAAGVGAMGAMGATTHWRRLTQCSVA